MRFAFISARVENYRLESRSKLERHISFYNRASCTNTLSCTEQAFRKLYQQEKPIRRDIPTRTDEHFGKLFLATSHEVEHDNFIIHYMSNIHVELVLCINVYSTTVTTTTAPPLLLLLLLRTSNNNNKWVVYRTMRKYGKHEYVTGHSCLIS